MDNNRRMRQRLNYITEGVYTVAIPMFYGDEIEYKILDENFEPGNPKTPFKNNGRKRLQYKEKNGIDPFKLIIILQKDTKLKI